LADGGIEADSQLRRSSGDFVARLAKPANRARTVQRHVAQLSFRGDAVNAPEQN